MSFSKTCIQVLSNFSKKTGVRNVAEVIIFLAVNARNVKWKLNYLGYCLYIVLHEFKDLCPFILVYELTHLCTTLNYYIYSTSSYFTDTDAINVQLFLSFSSLIFKHLATVKARLGCNFMMEIQKFAGESEDYVSRIWRHMVTVSRSIVEQLNCFKNAINALQVCEFLLSVPILIKICF